MDHRNLPWLGFHWQHPIVLLANSFLPLEVRVQLVLQRDAVGCVLSLRLGMKRLSYAGKQVVPFPVENWPQASQIHFYLFTYLFLIGKDILFNTFHFISFKQKNASISRKKFKHSPWKFQKCLISRFNNNNNKNVHSEVSGDHLSSCKTFFSWQLKILSR